MTQGFASSIGEPTNVASRPREVIRKPVSIATGSQSDLGLKDDIQLTRSDTPQPTNRDRYENKPMPAIPSEAADLIVSPSRRPYIQPAIPLRNPTTPQAKRAVTDPVGPKTYPVARKPSVSHLRKVFGHVKRPSKDDRNGSAMLPQTTRKAAIILGLPQQDQNEPFPAGVSTQSSGDASSGHSSQPCHESDEGSRSCELKEVESEVGRPLVKQAEKPVISISTEDGQTKRPGASDASRPQIRDSLSPKIANYGQVGDKFALHTQKLVRVESVQGIIEHADSTQHADSQSNDQRMIATPQESCDQTEQLPTGSSVTNSYKGVWENDPAVGYSLPPFSPSPRPGQGRPQDPMLPTMDPEISPSVYLDDAARQSLQPDFSTRSSTISQPFTASTPTMGPGQSSIANFMQANNDLLFNRQLPALSELRPQLGSANSWARTSVASEPISALLPPRWPQHHTNSVPPPPLTQQEYQRSDSLVAGISQLDRTIHHHIDQAFNGLSRLIIDKHDRMLDQVLRNLDDLGDTLAKNQKAIKSDLKGIHSGIHRLQAASTEVSAKNHSVQEQLKALEKSTTNIGKSLDDQSRHFRNIAESLDSRQPRPLANRRAESAHGSLATGTGGRIVAQDEIVNNVSKARNSKSSVRSHQSNPSNGGMTEHKAAKSGPAPYSLRGPPDIREHPAFAGGLYPNSDVVNQDTFHRAGGTTYAAQSLGEHGWYQQAYG